jgi:hypothetical protein
MKDTIEFNKEYVHYKNALTYIPINRCKIQENDVWVEAIIYKTVSEELFVRSLEEFQNKFTKKV